MDAGNDHDEDGREHSTGRFEPSTITVGGTTTTVRVATPDDVDRLVDLYAQLTPADLHRRFFSGFRPDPEFVRRWIDRSTTGGVVLVAVEGDPATGRVVADAGYVPTAADTAELAITVAPDRRGWIGPYVLDVLVEHARLHGISNLEAEVLTSNCGMLALLRARGCAFHPSEDLSIVSVLIGTAGSTPTWPADAGHPRVLVEGSPSAWAGSRAIAAAGGSVLACPGPDRGRTHACPLVHGDQCPLVDGADAVVVALPRSAASTADVIEAHTRRATDQPIALSAPLRDLDGDIAGRRTFHLDPGSDGERAIAELRDALAADEAEPDEAEPDDQDPGSRDAT